VFKQGSGKIISAPDVAPRPPRRRPRAVPPARAPRGGVLPEARLP
jgi:hypothetical protein